VKDEKEKAKIEEDVEVWLFVSFSFPLPPFEADSFFLQAVEQIARPDYILNSPTFNLYDPDSYRTVQELSPFGADIERLKELGMFHRKHLEGTGMSTIDGKGGTPFGDRDANVRSIVLCDSSSRR
jgi:hypothetical protein